MTREFFGQPQRIRGSSMGIRVSPRTFRTLVARNSSNRKLGSPELYAITTGTGVSLFPARDFLEADEWAVPGVRSCRTYSHKAGRDKNSKIPQRQQKH